MEAQSTQPTRSSWGRSAIEGAGAALLLAPGYIWNQLSQTHLDLYHRLLPITTVARALAIDVAVLWLVAALMVRGLDGIARGKAIHAGRQSNFRNLLWALWLGLLAARAVEGLIVAQIFSWQELSAARAFLVTAGVLFIPWLVAPRLYAGMVRGIRVIVLVFGFCIFWALPMLAVAGFAHQPHDEADFHRPIAAPTVPHHRIVWLLFDEMSYDQLFDHRWRGLDLPNFDRLGTQSTIFSDTQPDGYFTERIVPSLFLGMPIVDARSTEAGGLLYRTAKNAPWQHFDENATLFADARRDGWTTGISGDYNPYCRMLRGRLDSCAMRLIVFGEHLSRDKSTWTNVTAPVRAGWARALHRPFEPAPTEAQMFAEMMNSARNLVSNDGIDFAFVHLYLPHPPGFYDRKTGTVQFGGSYIDNLALADRSLGDLLQALGSTSSSDKTTLVVSSDHSWRVGIWRRGFGWTREDELASDHGRFDPRPLLLVRFPGESDGIKIARAFPLIDMHAMIEAMLAGRMNSAADLQTWAAQQ